MKLGPSPWSGNPLLRSSDRLEWTVAVVVVLLGLLAVPIAAAVGTEVYAGTVTASATRAAESTVVDAVVLADPAQTADPADAASRRVFVDVAWHTPYGEPREDRVLAPGGTRAGDRVPVWTDGRGERVMPPGTKADAVAAGIVVAAVLLFAAVALLAGALAACRAALDLRRTRTWAREWSAIAPAWSREYG